MEYANVKMVPTNEWRGIVNLVPNIPNGVVFNPQKQYFIELIISVLGSKRGFILDTHKVSTIEWERRYQPSPLLLHYSKRRHEAFIMGNQLRDGSKY